MIDVQTKNRIEEYLENYLSDKRKRHTYAVALEAINLAKRYGADQEKAELAALFHDMYRGKPIEVIDRMVREFSLDPTYLGNSNLAHGKLAAKIMEKEYDIKDQDILNAVAYHTTGRAGMSLLEKIVYLADAIEPGRRYPGIDELRKLAYISLDKACIKAMSRSIDYIKSRGMELDRDTLRAKNQLMEEERNTYD